MAKDTKNAIFIDDVEYSLEDMTDEQRALVSHVADLDRKIAGSRFQLDQLSVGRDAFMSMLKAALDKPVDDVKSE